MPQPAPFASLGDLVKATTPHEAPPVAGPKPGSWFTTEAATPPAAQVPAAPPSKPASPTDLPPAFSAMAFQSPAAFEPPPAFEAVPPVAPASPQRSAPEGAEDLTIISGIDAERQAALYDMGYVTLDDIARWSYNDARRVSVHLGVPEAEINNQWIFEAQSVLFDQYQQQVRTGS